MYTHSLNAQSGVAIITVVFIVALISTSALLLGKKQLELGKTNALLTQQNRVYNYVHSAKSIVASLLLADENQSYDGEDEDWYEQANAFLSAGIPLDERTVVSGSLESLDKYLNINNFIKINQGQVQIRTNPNFNTCLFSLATSEKIGITPINGDILEYLNNKTPKQKLISVSELKQISAIDLENYYKIKPYLFALDEVVKINVNMADKEVIACLHDRLNEFSAEEIIANRPITSFTEAKKIFQNAVGMATEQEASEYFNGLIAIKSTYFLLNLKITSGGTTFHAKVILKRDNKKITTEYQTIEYRI